MDTREGKYLPLPHCIKDTEGWQLNDKVQKTLDAKGCYKFAAKTHRLAYKKRYYLETRNKKMNR